MRKSTNFNGTRVRLTVLSIVVACCTAAMLLICNAPAMAEIILQDDFESPSDTESLTGRTTSTGQTWGDFNHYDPAPFGGTFTFRGGYETGSGSHGVGGGGRKGNSILLGRTLTTEKVRLGIDLTVQPNAQPKWPQIWFAGENNKGISFNWDANKNGVSSLNFEHSGTMKNNGAFSNQQFDTGMAPEGGQLHVDLDIDLGAKTLNVSWNEIGGNASGSEFYGTYSSDAGTYVNPNRLSIFVNDHGGGTHGFDNIVIEIIPEPTALVLLGLGTLVLGVRRRGTRR
jgi:hypothetical protein